MLGRRKSTLSPPLSRKREREQTEFAAPSATRQEIKPMKTERTMVTMRDGVRISVCVYRPAGDGARPALFAASPYQHEFDTVPAYPLFLWRETGPVEWYVSNGYAYVHADVRGSGGSEGEFGFMDRRRAAGLCRADRLDHPADLVQRQGRRHRTVLLRDGAVADGDAQPAWSRLHRAL